MEVLVKRTLGRIDELRSVLWELSVSLAEQMAPYAPRLARGRRRRASQQVARRCSHKSGWLSFGWLQLRLRFLLARCRCVRRPTRARQRAQPKSNSAPPAERQPEAGLISRPFASSHFEERCLHNCGRRQVCCLEQPLWRSLIIGGAAAAAASGEIGNARLRLEKKQPERERHRRAAAARLDSHQARSARLFDETRRRE